MSNKNLLPLNQALRILGKGWTKYRLTQLEDDGFITPIFTTGGHRRYSIESLQKLINLSTDNIPLVICFDLEITKKRMQLFTGTTEFTTLRLSGSRIIRLAEAIQKINNHFGNRIHIMSSKPLSNEWVSQLVESAIDSHKSISFHPVL